MKRRTHAVHYKKAMLCFFMALSCALLFPLHVKAACSPSVSDYIAFPPFLTAKVEANLLLMLDNSGSMYDLAYVDEQEYCFDDTYDTNNGYAGYFEADVWYYYNQALEQFEAREGDWAALQASGEWTGATGTACAHNDVNLKVNGDVVTTFFARGKFLNWATASKLDIQKEVLTGGKLETAGTYGAPNDRLVMESRGCLDKLFVKQVPVNRSGLTYYLTLGVRGPQESRFPLWQNGVAYEQGNLVSDAGDFWEAQNSGTSNGTGAADDVGVSWVRVTSEFRWTNGATYPPNSIVSGETETEMYITATGGTASGAHIRADTGITDWERYHVTHIEIFPVDQDGFNNTPCEAAIEGLQAESPNQGQIKADIEACMGYNPSDQALADSMSAFNHSVHNCWYRAKQGIWPPGAGPTESVMNDCERIYNAGTDPWEIRTEDTGYVCYGAWPVMGYVGRCWEPGEDAVWGCIKYHPDGVTCKKWGWIGGQPGGWIDSPDACIEQALMDYCGMLEIPEVIDPSDQAGETGEFWNIPAVLIDSGITAQQGEPIAVFKGHIKQDEPPEGLLQEFGQDLRIGAMIFNDYGSDSECDMPDPQILYNCSDPENRDGGKVISYIDMGEGHTTDLVAAINAIKATSWTPLAEAMYTAIGYYTQNSALRLDEDDFLMDGDHPDPVEYWCQFNNVLIITEGASTADVNPAIQTFTQAAGQNDGDAADLDVCGALHGSSRLDDLTYYAKEGDIYPAGNSQIDGFDKQNIFTHIVAAGSLRSTGSGDECSPDILLDNAAENGGTVLYNPVDPGDLERALRWAFSAIRAGAAAGSAASVISASRAGEGAIYQAIFFPVFHDFTGNSAHWFGDVHALFLDSEGNMREDTDQDDHLGDADRIVRFDGVSVTAKLYTRDPATGEETLEDEVGITDLKYIWATVDGLSAPDMDVLTQRTYAEPDPQRYIFTDYIDTSASVSMANVNHSLAMDFTPGFVNDTGNDNYFFLNPYMTYDDDDNPGTAEVALTEDQMIAEAQNIIRYIRGQEGLTQTGTNGSYRNRSVDMDSDGTLDLTLRLGDVIHSSPTVVSRPAENYDLLYKDDSYRIFRKHYMDRRIVVYTGANDGMLHAFNGGFYDAQNSGFVTQMSGETPFPLGAELWAYVPNALLPHLKWLAEPGSENVHVYYVDQKPRIFDARIFADDATHPGGWGTVLLGGMRLGGGPIGVDTDLDGTCDMNFTSTFFALDVTNPEQPPTLLWSFTDHNLGFTTTAPGVARVGDSWFVIVGSGPVDYDATRKDATGVMEQYGGSNRTASLYVLNAADGTLAREFVMDGHSFVSDPVAVDFDLATIPESPQPGDHVTYAIEAIYAVTDGCGA